jgi:hypothetical protein
MKPALHRSENLTILRGREPRTLEVEIRFSHSLARGTCDSTCPRCGRLGNPSHWELEGPDGTGNTMWLVCRDPETCGRNDGPGTSWTQSVTFAKGWEDRG